jgi:hypothetical protein
MQVRLLPRALSGAATPSVSDVVTNHWRTLYYHDAAHVLRRLRATEQELADVLREADHKVRTFRTTELNQYREWRDAALFTYGMGLAMGVPMGYATEATSDYDFVAGWVQGDTAHFCPVQLKELVAAERNPGATVDGLLLKLRKYGPTKTVLAIRLSRAGHMNLDRDWPAVPFAQLWFFWASAPANAEFSIYGDALGTPRQWAFDYPT